MQHDRRKEDVPRWYDSLLRMFPKEHRARFGDGMRQTFADLHRERRAQGTAGAGFYFWAFADITAGICRENINAMILQNRIFLRAGLVTLGLLLVPFVGTLANQNSHLRGGAGGGWDWGPLDFVIMGALILLAAVAIQWAIRRLAKLEHRLIAVGGIALLFLLIWLELAVDAVSRAVGAIL